MSNPYYYAQAYSGVVGVYWRPNFTGFGSVEFLVPELEFQQPAAVDGSFVYQEFELPADYVRAGFAIPPLTAVQIYASVEDERAATAALRYTIEHLVDGNWELLVSGIQAGAHVHGAELWFDIYFHTPVTIEADWLDDTFRLGIAALSNDAPQERVLCTYLPFINGIGWLYAPDGTLIQYNLWPGARYYWHSGYFWWNPADDNVYFWNYFGLSHFWFWYGPVPAYVDDPTSPVTVNDQPASLRFKLLAGVADDTEDALGNKQRHVVESSSATHVDTIGPKAAKDFWLSKPNPSKFAVECLYFDVRADHGKAAVIDKILLDPITAGVYCNVYYSVDGDSPGTTDRDWEQKLWSTVPRPFRMDQRETFSLPEPITAKYICLEFTHLRPEQYDPGDIQFPIHYKKHPKWVLNYFLVRSADLQTDDRFVASRVNIQYNALTLAYDYFLDDLQTSANTPPRLTAQDNTNFLLQYLQDRTELSELVDPDTLRRIRTVFNTFQTRPRESIGALNSLLSTYGPTIDIAHPTESITTALANTVDVSTTRREALVVEQSMPVMFFYVTSRHTYREVTAEIESKTAYFVGLKDVAFTRDRYSAAYDGELYIEGVGDNGNAERNDFITHDFAWITHDSRGAPPATHSGHLYSDYILTNYDDLTDNEYSALT